MRLEDGRSAAVRTLPNGVRLQHIVDGPFNATRINSKLAIARQTIRDPRTTPLPMNDIDTSRLVTVTPRGQIGEMNLTLPSDIPVKRSIEDPRYVQSTDRPNEGVIGVTVAWRNKRDEIVWKPALVPVRVEGSLLIPTAAAVVFDAIAKNITPVDFNAEKGIVRFMVRHDDRGEKHNLTYYTYNFKTGKLEEEHTMTMRKIDANGKTGGTTGGETIHIGGQDVTIFHGQQHVNSPSGAEIIAYSLFPAVVENGEMTAIGDPFLTPTVTDTSPKAVVYADDSATVHEGSGGEPVVKLLASIDDGNIVSVTAPASVLTDSLRRIRRP